MFGIVATRTTKATGVCFRRYLREGDERLSRVSASIFCIEGQLNLNRATSEKVDRQVMKASKILAI